MSEIDIRISPAAQLVALVAVLAAAAGLIATQVPEIRRYLNVRGM